MERHHDPLVGILGLSEQENIVINHRLNCQYCSIKYKNKILKTWRKNHIFYMEKEFLLIYEQIGANIKQRRKELGLTQKQVALRANPKLDRAKISDMENGKEDFTFSTLLRICKALDVDIKSLLNTI